jgi:hypothetical protein
VGYGFVCLLTLVPLMFQRAIPFGSIFIHGKIHETVIGFLLKFI